MNAQMLCLARPIIDVQDVACLTSMLKKSKILSRCWITMWIANNIAIKYAGYELNELQVRITHYQPPAIKS